MNDVKRLAPRLLQGGLWLAVSLLLFGASYQGARGPTAFSEALQITLSLTLIAATVSYGVLWIVDRAPSAPLKQAGLFAAWSLGTGFVLHPIGRLLGFAEPVMQDIVNTTFLSGVALAVRAGWRGIEAQAMARRESKLRQQSEERLTATGMTPHILYNILNALYASSLTDPERTPKLILALAEMMQYLTKASNSETASLDEELDFIESFQLLTLERLGDRGSIVVQRSGPTSGQVPILTLATLFENAVKYGVDGEGRQDIRVSYEGTDEGFSFVIDNARGKDHPPGLGSGLKLVRSRLQQAFPGRYSFEAGWRSDRFYTEVRVW